mmetsp:Transcript_6596/g.23240  ORF Transcript_6596/g.23240 Transcript_6596/m.23240 type:complete len:102 (+) Transcript_6596:1399-1704(+)
MTSSDQGPASKREWQIFDLHAMNLCTGLFLVAALGCRGRLTLGERWDGTSIPLSYCKFLVEGDFVPSKQDAFQLLDGGCHVLCTGRGSVDGCLCRIEGEAF